MNTKWEAEGFYCDWSSPHAASIHRIKEVKLLKETDFQTIIIVDTYDCDRCLILGEKKDGMVSGRMNVSLRDEALYHEPLVHTAMLSLPVPPKNILIVGGGDGGALREVMRYRDPNLRCTMVEIDEGVVDACIRFLPQVSNGAFGDIRARTIFQDALVYLKETSVRWDIIILDLNEPEEHGPAHPLFTKEFYQLVYQRLNSDGYVAIQAGSAAIGNLTCLSSVYKTVRAAGFGIVLPYRIAPPSFGEEWVLILASPSGAPNLDPRRYAPLWIDRQIQQHIKGDLHFYNGAVHKAQFALGNNVMRGIGIGCDSSGRPHKGIGRVIEASTPFHIYTT